MTPLKGDGMPSLSRRSFAKIMLGTPLVAAVQLHFSFQGLPERLAERGVAADSTGLGVLSDADRELAAGISGRLDQSLAPVRSLQISNGLAPALRFVSPAMEKPAP